MKRDTRNGFLRYAVWALACLPGAAMAHSAESGAGLVAGLLHPALGMDHYSP